VSCGDRWVELRASGGWADADLWADTFEQAVENILGMPPIRGARARAPLNSHLGANGDGHANPMLKGARSVAADQ
jgi:hypothetical protein